MPKQVSVERLSANLTLGSISVFLVSQDSSWGFQLDNLSLVLGLHLSESTWKKFSPETPGSTSPAAD
jgi:hypothetical protein